MAENDRERPLPPCIVIGKGVGVRYVERGPYHVAAVSEAVRHCARCDWLGVNDIAALRSLLPADWAKVGTLVLPTHLHGDSSAAPKLVRFEKAIRHVPANRFAIFRLHTAPASESRGPNLLRCWSTAESLIGFLLHVGYREFLFNGITRQAAYDPRTPPRNQKKAHHYAINHRRCVNRIGRAGGTVKEFEQ